MTIEQCKTCLKHPCRSEDHDYLMHHDCWDEEPVGMIDDKIAWHERKIKQAYSQLDYHQQQLNALKTWKDGHK